MKYLSPKWLLSCWFIIFCATHTIAQTTIVIGESGGKSIIPLTTPSPVIEITNADLEEVDVQARNIFNAFVQNDIQIIESYLPSFELYADFLSNTYIKNKKKRSQLAFDGEKEYQKFHDKACESFSRSQERATEYGTNVNDLEIIDINHRLPRNPSRVATSVVITAKDKESQKTYSYIIGSLISYNGNWIIGGKIKFKSTEHSRL